MDAKARTKMGYDLFNKGDMETFFKEMVDENTTWTFPGKEGVHPLSGVHKGPQAMMAAMGQNTCNMVKLSCNTFRYDIRR